MAIKLKFSPDQGRSFKPITKMAQAFEKMKPVAANKAKAFLMRDL